MEEEQYGDAALMRDYAGAGLVSVPNNLSMMLVRMLCLTIF